MWGPRNAYPYDEILEACKTAWNFLIDDRTHPLDRLPRVGVCWYEQAETAGMSISNQQLQPRK